jgi:hypothetical protein
MIDDAFNRAYLSEDRKGAFHRAALRADALAPDPLARDP